MSQTQFITKEKKMDSEKIFQNQKEILEYLGKNPNDRNLISRMIRKWEIERMEDWYRIVEKVNVEEVEELKERVAKQEKMIAELEEENKRLKETQSGEPIQEKRESGKPNMDKLREIVAGKFLSEPKEEKQQFMKGGDKREWNWNIMEYTWKIVLKKKVFRYSHENKHWYWVEDLCRYDKWRLVKLEHNDGEVYEDGVIDIDPEELSFYFEN